MCNEQYNNVKKLKKIKRIFVDISQRRWYDRTQDKLVKRKTDWENNT